jgi:hypothetical protein
MLQYFWKGKKRGLKKLRPAKVRDRLNPAAAGLIEGVLLKRTIF